MVSAIPKYKMQGTIEGLNRSRPQTGKLKIQPYAEIHLTTRNSESLKFHEAVETVTNRYYLTRECPAKSIY